MRAKFLPKKITSGVPGRGTGTPTFAVDYFQPYKKARFKCKCPRTTACRATHRKRRAPEARRYAACVLFTSRPEQAAAF